ncbi:MULTISPECIES: prenyltransferase/squalene oxidase repeat-containing protein [unclassified Streptomyces]|uniref:prenyltransferase/squalene oxidase repeat-containing protein n=1 Tax=unclassified Streptomyces TaxID=2593676 RepID=UPI0036CA96AC
MNIRRSAALVAATAVIGMATAPAALADDSAPSASPSVAIPSGLYGKADPTYDGVWRQSLSLLAQHTTGVKPAAKAVDWLTGQQCANGGFAAFRADTGKACDAKTPLDSNSTGAAVQALAALGGHDAEVGKAVKWLESVRGDDGGWGYNPGGASDANSTSVVIGALAAAGEKVTSAQAALVKLSIPCGKDGGGAFAYQPDKKGKLAANADATAAGVLGGLGKGLAADGAKQAGAPSCKGSGTPDAAQAAQNGSAYLTEALAKDHHLMSSMPGAKDQPDYGNTADAVTALSAAGHGDQAAPALSWLEKNATQWAAQSGPAAYAQLVLASHAAGADPRDFGGTDLVKALNATGPAPSSTKAAAEGKKDEEKKDDGGISVWYVVAVAAVAGIGIGFLFSGRKKQQL